MTARATLSPKTPWVKFGLFMQTPIVWAKVLAWLYGGACGYISYAGDMDVAIAIRTAVIKDQTLYVQAAAGVVADSVPEMEWRETEHKARALLRASELVEEGLE